MQTEEESICNCDFIIDITYCDNFVSLDQALLNSVTKVTGATYAGLYIGEYGVLGEQQKILAETGEQASSSLKSQAALNEWRGSNVIPIELSAGRALTLLLDSNCDEVELKKLSQLLTVYKNQHEHLTRSNKDKLTNLKNRRAFDIEYQLLTDAPLSLDKIYILAVLDIDFFKQVNDKHGHLIGDETLIAVSHLMKDFFLREDNLYRFGGEEFIILFSVSSLEQAGEQLNDLRIKISKYPFPQVGKKTVSIGYIEIEAGVDNDLLFERADAALYYAKSSGRNCIKNYEELVQEDLIEPVNRREGAIELF